MNDTDLTADNHKKNVIIIACSVVAGVLLILASFLICFCYRRKRQREGSFDYNKKQPAIVGSSNETKGK